MENASKALIIAGAVLISIVLVSVGMMILNGANDGVDNGVKMMNKQAKDMFNQEFLGYEGTKSGSEVQALIQAIISSNNQNAEIQGKTIDIKFDNKLKADGSKETTTHAPALTDVIYGNTFDVAAAQTFSDSAMKMKRSIGSGRYYVVECNIDSGTGLVNTVTIRY